MQCDMFERWGDGSLGSARERGPAGLRPSKRESRSATQHSMSPRPVTVNEDYDDGDLTMLRAISAGLICYVYGLGMIAPLRCRAPRR